MISKVLNVLGSAALVAATPMIALAGDGVPPLATLPPPPIPVDNPMTPEKIELGKKLFFDGRLSGDTTTACSACHSQDVGWGTGGAISFGYPGSTHWRNSQTILNSAYYNKLFWDGSSQSLEAQAKTAAGGAVGGNIDGSMAEMRLRFTPEYVAAFKNVFGTDYPSTSQAWAAIAAFERTIVTDPKQVPFDRYLAGDTAALSAPAKAGMEVFNGKGGCITCHNGALASDEQFYNIGVPTAPEFSDDPLSQITQRYEIYAKGVSEATYHTTGGDLGLYFKTKRPSDVGKFRVPSLRELRWTDPYMHNGTLATLADVVDFYDAGGGAGNPSLKALGLSATEKTDLVAFLEALSMDQPLTVTEPDLPATATWAELAK